ncbi:AIR synthase related protein [Methanocorpusculum labreanum Z]|uniref:AIR synthase related protein n=1 Tax=Methanocorpusculum labreanum (strain ATCC 43576 / DSM 4855 / Z) TaxID=410358 RepID=A2SRR1_METLZ|nr:AIR synthase-related protein [Methanocorpusculum labreanum]ABN07017.1 AIR synthase related protein [Methanocorpusculum labreanum Z]
MDVEGFVRRSMHKDIPEGEIEKLLQERILDIKNIDDGFARDFARAVIEEVKVTSGLKGDLFEYEHAGVSMGEFGVGSRGSGDFYAHRKIAHVIGQTSAQVGVDQMDDGGVVEANGQYIITTVDGMHSRLSDFPFLAGFHATRATLRDVYVMGARPVGLISDVHIADDGDVAKLFDYTAGITTVSDALGVPLVAGSTLRIGGDMVLGDRMTGCVGVVGVANHVTARRSSVPGDVLLMTRGAGGGTIATAALYSGNADVVEETINLHFLKACDALIRSDVFPHIHAMTDITNGGLRGDVFEIAETAKATVVVEDAPLRGLIAPKVLALLDKLGIDYLGVSLDALLVIVPPEYADEVIRVVGTADVPMERIGFVREGPGVSRLIKDGVEGEFLPKFREAPYTPVKKVVDRPGRDFEEMKKGIDRAADAARAKKERVLKRLL